MAWASKKQYAILMSSEEGKDLAEQLGEMEQDEFNKKFNELLGKTGQSIQEEDNDDIDLDEKDDNANDSTESTKDNELSELEEQYNNEKSRFARVKILNKINAIKLGYDSVDEYLEDVKKIREEEDNAKRLKAEQEKQEKLNKEKEKEEQKKKQLEEDIKNATEHQNKQFEIIQQNNSMTDDYHVGIRSPKDIKTFEEVINDDDSFAWGDFSKEEAQQSLKSGYITIYSSYPIKQGTFVSTSKKQAEEYAGGEGKKVYTKKIPLSEVAWINGDEGQYAKVN